MPPLPDTVRATIARYTLMPPDPVVLAMVSGGADSIALLRLLASGDLGEPGDLSVLHINHGLRGAASDADEAFVTQTCEALGVPCDVVRYDVAGYAAAQGLNLEDAGRRIRYRFAEDALDAKCAAAGAASHRGRIAVAHTFDDRLETFLARIVAGAGAGGLRSIQPTRGRIVRPLLDARRAEIVAYLRDLGQPWREDATNADISRQRAWVRHELLPVIESRNASFDATAARMLAVLGDEDDLLAEMAEAFARDFTRLEGDVLVFERGMMATLSRPMCRRTIRHALCATFPEASRIEYEHVDALVDGMNDERFARDLSFGLRAEAEYSTLRISRTPEGEDSVAPGLLPLSGTALLGAAGTMVAREAPAVYAGDDADRVTIDADSVRWPLVIDAVREGDRMRPLGMEGTKKVGDLLTDAKVPRRLRRLVPIVRDGDRVVWVAGVRLSEESRVGPHTTRIAELVWERP